MDLWFDIGYLDVERLLREWRWLCPDRMTLVARSAFGDLFLCNASGIVFKLDVAIGKLTKIAGCEDEFRELSETQEKQEEWFAKSDELTAEERGLIPSSLQCIGFETPLAFKSPEGAPPNKPYIADIYEYVSFLGDLNRQISDLPNGSTVRLKVNDAE